MPKLEFVVMDRQEKFLASNGQWVERQEDAGYFTPALALVVIKDTPGTVAFLASRIENKSTPTQAAA
jgi:hypothetical protein